MINSGGGGTLMGTSPQAAFFHGRYKDSSNILKNRETTGLHIDRKQLSYRRGTARRAASSSLVNGCTAVSESDLNSLARRSLEIIENSAIQ